MKLNEQQVAEIKQKMMNGGTSKDAQYFAKKFGVSMGTIYHIKAGDRWKNVGFTPTEDAYKFTPVSWHFRRLPFWDRVQLQTEVQENGCHIFTGSKDEFGYGRISNGSKLVRIHREVWKRAHGEISRYMFVCHKCDTPACINLEHLFLGTHAENMADKAAKGRGRTRPQKLTKEQVKQIRILLSSGIPGAKIAKLFNVSAAGISYIKHGKNWKSVE